MSNDDYDDDDYILNNNPRLVDIIKSAELIGIDNPVVIDKYIEYKKGKKNSKYFKIKILEDKDYDKINKETIDKWKELALQIRKPKVLIADYDLLKKDFIELRLKTNDQINEYLLNNYLITSKHNKDRFITCYNFQNTLKKTLEKFKAIFGDSEVNSYRPPQYGRACIFDISNDGFVLYIDEMMESNKNDDDEKYKEYMSKSNKGIIDIKGVGIDTTVMFLRGAFKNIKKSATFSKIEKNENYNDAYGPESGDGLMYKTHALKEYFNEKIISKILLVNNNYMSDIANIRTVGGYAVLDTGLQFYNHNKKKENSCLYLRRVHQRNVTNNLSPDQILNKFTSLIVSNILSLYGLTTSYFLSNHDTKSKKYYLYRILNVQGTANLTECEKKIYIQLFDFDTYIPLSKAEASLYMGINFCENNTDPKIYQWGQFDTGLREIIKVYISSCIDIAEMPIVDIDIVRQKKFDSKNELYSELKIDTYDLISNAMDDNIKEYIKKLNYFTSNINPINSNVNVLKLENTQLMLSNIGQNYNDSLNHPIYSSSRMKNHADLIKNAKIIKKCNTYFTQKGGRISNKTNKRKLNRKMIRKTKKYSVKI